MAVNQPAVRLSSAPGTASSWRPWLSRSTTTGASGFSPRTRRHSVTASAKVLRRTSLIVAWQTPGTQVSSASVMSASSSAVISPALAWVSRVRSRRSVRGVSPSTERQWSSSASMRGSSAMSARDSAHRRHGVSTGASGSPAKAAARSGMRMRQVTPSMTRWLATSTSSPSRSAPRSSQTAWSIRPSAGASRERAARACSVTADRTPDSSRPMALYRIRQSATATEPGSGTWIVQSSATRMRRASWWSSTVSRAAPSASKSRAAGTRSTRDWLNSATSEPSSANHPIIGVRGAGPWAGMSAPCCRAWSVPGPAVADSASSAGVWCSKTSRTDRTRPAARARPTSWMERMLSPPRSKKPSSIPTDSAPRTSANSSDSNCSRGLRAVRPDVRAE